MSLKTPLTHPFLFSTRKEAVLSTELALARDNISLLITLNAGCHGGGMLSLEIL